MLYILTSKQVLFYPFADFGAKKNKNYTKTCKKHYSQMLSSALEPQEDVPWYEIWSVWFGFTQVDLVAVLAVVGG